MFEIQGRKLLAPKSFCKEIVVGSVEKEIKAIMFELVFKSSHLKMFYIKNSKYPHSIYHLQTINYVSLFITTSQYYSGKTISKIPTSVLN